MTERSNGRRPETRADPRERTDRLGWVTRAVFPDERVWLGLAQRSSEPPPGIRVAARFLVVPSADAARFLLPVASRRVAVASMLAYNALRPPVVRAARLALGGIRWLGASPQAPLLQVGVPEGVDDQEVLLLAELAARLGEPRLHAAIGVPTPDPNYKPTLQLFDDRGRPRGYAKIGWNDATRALVAAETATLRRIHHNGGPSGSRFPYVPRLLWSGDRVGQRVAVVEPLPAAVRRERPSGPPRLAEMLAVAREIGGRGAGHAGRFGESAYLAGLAQRADEAAGYGRLAGRAAGGGGQLASGEGQLVAGVGGDMASGEGGRLVGRAVAALRHRDGATTVALGGWHGDWVPWNLGRLSGGRLAVWDWEHSGPDAPIGLDLVHQGFQTALILHRAGACGAAAAAAGLLRRHGPELGLGPSQQPLVLDAYLIELWLRTWRLAAAGAGWNSALHPDLLAVLHHRLAMA